MSGKASQRKGRTAELDLVRILQGYGYNVRPGNPLNYGKEADVVRPSPGLQMRRAL